MVYTKWQMSQILLGMLRNSAIFLVISYIKRLISKFDFKYH